MPTCYILIGCPGAGKTTFINENRYDITLGEDQCALVVLSTDDYIERIAEALKRSYDDVFKDAYKLAEKIMWEDLVSWDEEESDIIIDRTNMTVKGRAKFIKALPNYDFVAITFETPSDLAKRLASRPGKTIPEGVITGMLANYQAPTVEEGFSKIYTSDEFATLIYAP